MKLFYRTPLTMSFLAVIILLFTSCAKDNDLFDEYVLNPGEEVVDPDAGSETPDVTNPNEEPSNEENNASGGTSRPSSTGGNPNWFLLEPTVAKPVSGESYSPKSSAEISNPANAGKTAIISNSFNCDNCTFASNQLIVPNGGIISGSNINLNGSYIDQVLDQAFANNSSFSELYEDSWVAPEVFGGFSDDGNDDQAAIETLIKNVKFARSKANGRYIKNGTNFINRGGDFIWDFNNSVLSVTSTSGYSTTQTSRDYIIWTGNINVKLYNGEINGGNKYGRAIWLIGPQAYHFENFRVRDLFSTVDYRAVAIKVEIFTDAPLSEAYGAIGSVAINKNFENGYMNSCTIENIYASGDCVFNNSPSGVAKGVWLSYVSMDPSKNATIYHENNLVQNIFGEDAEGIYFDDKTFGGGGRVNEHGVYATLYNETVRECNRRALKSTVSNVTLEECTFEMISAENANKAMATLVDFFVFNNTANPEDHNTNINVINCSFIQPDILPRNDSNCGGSIPDATLLSIADTYNATITGNIFDRPDLDNYAGIRLGSSAFPGKIRSSTFSGNKFINCGYDFLPYCINEGNSPVIIENEIFDYDITGTGGASHGVFRFRSNGKVQNFKINNIEVDINWSSSINQFYGLLYSAGAEVSEFEFSNINIKYSNAPGIYFGRTQGDLGSSNSFQNILMSNADGSNSFIIEGQQGPVLNNCVDDSGRPITID